MAEDVEVEEMLERELKNPPIFLVSGGAALIAEGAGAFWMEGEVAGVLPADDAFHSLNPHRVLALLLLAESVGGADCTWRPGGCMPMLFSEIKVLSAFAHVSDASCDSRASVNSWRVSSSCSLTACSSFLSSSTSEASTVGGRSGGVGVVRPNKPEIRLEVCAGSVGGGATPSCKGSSRAVLGGLPHWLPSPYDTPGSDTDEIRRCALIRPAGEPVRGANELRRDAGGPASDDEPARDKSSAMEDLRFSV